MANNVTEVFRVAVPSVGLVLKARADIDGKQDAFVRRVKEDAENGEVEILTEYSANMLGVKLLDHLILGSPYCESKYVSIEELSSK